MRNLKLYNTLSRKLEDFVPIINGACGVYSCGPTVYDHAHLGNLRAYIASDILVRVLRSNDLEVNHVMNLTDVGHLTSDADEGEDKMELSAARQNKSAWELAEFYASSFFSQCESLSIKRPNLVCKATDHIPQQISMIQKLESKGFTYQTVDGIYFDTSKDKGYGKLARLNIEGLRAGARVELGHKKHSTDFALWKFSGDKNRQMEWQSPWGLGFPGWHIECSAMATHYLGEQFDIHTGGVDHIPVHHTNEIAQCENASGHSPLSRYWLHSEFLLFSEDSKMSKSTGNTLRISDIQERRIDAIAFRLLCLKAHYRSTIKFSWETLEGVERQFKRLKTECQYILKASEFATETTMNLGASGKKYLDDIERSFDDDLSTPRALTIFQDLLKDDLVSALEKKIIGERADEVFGLGLFESSGSVSDRKPISAALSQLLAMRANAKQNNDWEEADSIRDKIKAQGYLIEDGPDGPVLRALR